MTEELNRKTLYDLVWSKPMTAIAKEYGLSDRGLAKLCERNSIPVPSRGYWAKKTAGQKVTKAPLLVLEGSKPETAILLSKAEPLVTAISSKKEKPTLPESIQEAITRESLPENQIKVPATMHSPHPIVASWIKEAEQSEALNRTYSWRTITSLDRRKWRLTSCLFKQLEARGFKVIEENDNRYRKEAWIKYENDKVSFDIYERIRQYRREITAEEKAKSYSSNQKWTTERENTGKLEITLAPGENSYSKIKIQEDDSKAFEDMLNEVVVKIIETMWDAKCRRLEKQEDERKRQKEDLERYERRQSDEKEKKRKSNLEYKVFSWKRAQAIRDYIAAVEKSVAEGLLQVEETEFSDWKTWALAYANEMDFVTNGNPLISLSNDPENLGDNDSKQSGYGNSPSNSSSGHPLRKWYNK